MWSKVRFAWERGKYHSHNGGHHRQPLNDPFISKTGSRLRCTPRFVKIACDSFLEIRPPLMIIHASYQYVASGGARSTRRPFTSASILRSKNQRRRKPEPFQSSANSTSTCWRTRGSIAFHARSHPFATKSTRWELDDI